MKLTVTILAICCTLLAACSPDVVEPEIQGSIHGTVLNAENGVHISEVSVETTPATEAVITSPNGEFRLNNIATGSYQLKASKPGYSSKSVMVMVNESRTTSATIQLTPLDDRPKSKLIDAEVTAWEQTGRSDSSFVNVEYRINNTSDSETIGELEVYFDIHTDRETYLFEVNNTELAGGEQNIGNFEKFVRDRVVDSVTVSGVWVKEE